MLTADQVIVGSLIFLTAIIGIGGVASLLIEKAWQKKNYGPARKAHHGIYWSKDLKVLTRHLSCSLCTKIASEEEDRYVRRNAARRS